VDFEPFQGGEFVDSELGRIPKGWRVGTLGELTERIYSGGTPSTTRPEYWNGSLPWLSSGETGLSYISRTQKRITQEGVDGSSTRKAYAYDTVIASAGQGYTRGQTSLLLIDTYINQSLVVLHSDPLFRLYVFIALQKRYDELRAISDAHSIRGSLTTKMVSGLSILVPLENVIEKFNVLYQALLQHIVQNLLENHSLISIRDSLLPKLMHGDFQFEAEVNV
jgi:type I restriction enzyme, S subunit